LLSANRRYAAGGVRPGTPAVVARRRLGLRGRPFNVGTNTWYLFRRGPAELVLKVRHGVVVEVGVADGRLNRGRRAQLRYLRSFG
jgi:hypothetical protein